MVDFKAVSLSSLHAPIRSHITEFFSIINNLDKTEVKIEDEDQALLLLCYLSSSYKSFRKAIIYRGKSTIKVNEVKKHLLNKDKIDTQLTGESLHESGQVHYSSEKNNNESFTGNSKHKDLVCKWCHKKGHIRADCWIRKKKQTDANIAELAEEDEDKCDVLSVTGESVDNKDRWVIDSRCSQPVSYTHLTLPTIYSV